MRRLGRLTILLAVFAGIAPRVSAQARGQATVTPDRAVLPSLAGEYTAGTITMTVTLLEDGTLTLFFPGQQLYHLVPETRFRYRMRELNPGFGIGFLTRCEGNHHWHDGAAATAAAGFFGGAQARTNRAGASACIRGLSTAAS